MSKITHIQGPITFRYLTKDNKKLYLFGDMHLKKRVDCPDSETIVEVLNNITEKYNLYLEGDPRQVDEERELSNYLREVIKGVKSDKVKNVNYTDVRHIYFNYIEKGVSSLLYYLGNLGKGLSDNTLDNNKLINQYINKIVEVYEDYLKYEEDTDKLLNNVMFGFKNMNFLDKISNLRKNNPELTKNLLNFFQEEKDKILTINFSNIYQGILNDFGILIKSIEETGQVPSIFFKSLIANYETIFILDGKIAELTGLYMDVYLLFQLITTDTNNNVIYAGEAHCEKYTRFFKSLGYNLVFTKFDLDQCISLDDIKLPLFSQ